MKADPTLGLPLLSVAFGPVKGRYCPVAPDGDPIFIPFPTTTHSVEGRPARAQVGVSTLWMRGVIPAEPIIFAAMLPGRELMTN
jgi:hypothetical protein